MTTERAVLSALLGLLPEQVGNMPHLVGRVGPPHVAVLTQVFSHLYHEFPFHRVGFQGPTHVYDVTKTNDKGGNACLIQGGLWFKKVPEPKKIGSCLLAPPGLQTELQKLWVGGGRWKKVRKPTPVSGLPTAPEKQRDQDGVAREGEAG